jgi:hypothetical protein
VAVGADHPRAAKSIRTVRTARWRPLLSRTRPSLAQPTRGSPFKGFARRALKDHYRPFMV